MREFLRGCPGILFSCGNFFKCHSKSFQKYFIKREIVSLPLGHPISNNSSNTKGSMAFVTSLADRFSLMSRCDFGECSKPHELR